MSSPVALSFVLLEYNCVDDVESCLASLEAACQSIEHEVIISSNSEYPPEKEEELKERFPGARWKFNRANLGFAAGMNKGIAVASHDLIVVMNLDVLISKGEIREACEYHLSQEKLGVIGPRIVDEAGVVQDSCRPFMGLGQLFSRMWKRVFHRKDVLHESGFDYSKVQIVDWVIGGFMMLKRKAIDEVGMFDPGYFLYVEDMDWCKRFWDKGWSVAYYPRLEVTYKGDRKSLASLFGGSMKNKYCYYHVRSYLRFLIKNRFIISRKK